MDLPLQPGTVVAPINEALRDTLVIVLGFMNPSELLRMSVLNKAWFNGDLISWKLLYIKFYNTYPNLPNIEYAVSNTRLFCCRAFWTIDGIESIWKYGNRFLVSVTSEEDICRGPCGMSLGLPGATGIEGPPSMNRPREKKRPVKQQYPTRKQNNYMQKHRKY